MISAEVVGFIAGGIGMFFGLPQALRVRRLGHGRGVSLISWLFLFGTATCWASYGFAINSPSVLLTNIGAALVNASVIMAIIKNNLKSIVLLSIYASALSALILNLPSAVVSTILILVVFAQTPQIVRSYKNLHAGAHTAVSISALSVSSISIALWFIYALLADVSLILLSASIAVSLNISVIVLELIGKRRRALKTT
ncbi:hypothetical protein [Candidatus Planktophila dulcis]|uniref:hypothetical protein n=1 Tax=Candidatus Planktophila dulcis TaxID=1884914 RepID=UPI003CED3A56